MRKWTGRLDEKMDRQTESDDGQADWMRKWTGRLKKQLKKQLKSRYSLGKKTTVLP